MQFVFEGFPEYFVFPFLFELGRMSHYSRSRVVFCRGFQNVKCKITIHCR